MFVRVSFFKDLRFGRLDEVFQLTNYVTFFTDPFYLRSLWLTVELSAIVAGLALALAYPVAYALARMPPRWASTLLALAVISAFITIVIKVLGLIIILLNYDDSRKELIEHFTKAGTPCTVYLLCTKAPAEKGPFKAITYSQLKSSSLGEI